MSFYMFCYNCLEAILQQARSNAYVINITNTKIESPGITADD